ncbi:MAG: NUDIX hydrolase [Planctomycetes bacterium]|nr:NUDIX hydrolase [Planctomycetota bacterium]
MSTHPKTVLVTAKFSVLEHSLTTPTQPTPLVRHTVEHRGAVAIIPLLDDDRVCLIRNRRIAIGKTLVELPAGTLEPDEPPRHTAERELQEETGYRAARWHELNGFFMSPGILNERMHLFVARDLTPGPPAREADEAIDNLVVSWDEAIAMVLRGEIEDAKSLAGLLLWDKLRQDG